jgi:hypothetical protein
VKVKALQSLLSIISPNFLPWADKKLMGNCQNFEHSDDRIHTDRQCNEGLMV